MRRIASSLALASAGALAAIALPATAHAATDSGSAWDSGKGAVSEYSVQAKAKEPKPIGRKHSFRLTTRGTKVTGYWYYAKLQGHKEIWLRTNVARTSGHYTPAVCFVGNKVPLSCFWSAKPSKPFTRTGWLSPATHLKIEAATGQSKKKGLFSIYYHSAWYRVG